MKERGKMMDAMCGHLWFSKKQKREKLMHGEKACIGLLDSGEKVEYTEGTATREITSKQDDFKYLGRGYYLRRT